MSDSRTWRCTVCGYIHQGDGPPDCCPVCGAAPSDFEPYVLESPRKQATVNQWRCMNCNYVHDGPEPPEVCPICGAPPDRFEAVVKTVATGHSEDALRVVIIGGGIAGVSAAEAARDTAPNSKVTMLCQEQAVPYYRLNLTRYLAAEIERDVLPIHAQSWYGEQGIDIRVGAAVTGVSREENAVSTSDGDNIEYDRLILAMGSHAFIPPLPGADLDGVTALRTAEEADDILERLRKGSRCVVIGGGILGLETAGALGSQGADVTLLESHEWLMPRQLNRKAADLLETHIESLGVTVRKAARTARIVGDGTVSGIELTDGDAVEAAVVILATGVRPNTALARKAALEVNRGILVNNRLQTSDPRIYAAGDVAEHNGRLYGAWAPSQYQGRIAGLNACDVPSEFGGLPRSNALKVLGVDMLSVGQFEPEDGSYSVLDQEADGKLMHFLFHDGRLVGAILMGHPELGPSVKAAVESRMDFSTLLRSTVSTADVISRLNG